MIKPQMIKVTMNKAYLWTWRLIFNVFFKKIYNVKIYGLEKFPKEGPVIAAPNHMSNFDPPLVGCALTRHINFMAKEELFRNYFARHLITWLGAFPVKRDSVDKLAIRHAMDLLKHGLVLGIFPEGTRQKPGHLGPFHDGVASLALRMAVPVVPIAIIGSEHMTRGKVALVIGDPIQVEKAKVTPEKVREINDTIRASIEDMIESYHKGVL